MDREHHGKDVPFLFVNKDAANLQSKDHLKAVSSFFHQRRPRTVKVERLKKLRASVLVTHFPWEHRDRSGSLDVSTSHQGTQHYGTSKTLAERPKTRVNNPRTSRAFQKVARQALKAPELSSIPLQPAARSRTSESQLRRNVTGSYPDDGSYHAPKMARASSESVLPTMPSSAVPTSLGDQLDPFLRLPVEISPQDKRLLHYYLVTMPAAVYGTHSRAMYCPIRDTTRYGVSSSEIFLQWVILATEVFVAGRRSLDTDASILRRKSYIYRIMNETISDPTKRYTGRTFSALATAGIAEARIGNVLTGRMHLKALKHLLIESGASIAIQKLDLSGTLPVISAFISVGTADATFTSIPELESAKEKLAATLWAMQQWNTEISTNLAPRRGQSDDNHNYRHSSHPSVPQSDQKALDSLRKYQSSRSGTFCVSSPLRQFVEAEFSDTNPAQKRSHVAILYIINKTLWELRYDYEESIRFLNKLKICVRTGHIPDESGGSAVPSLKALTVVYHVVHSAASYGEQTDQSGGILRSFQAIDPIELIELLSENSRRKVLEHLSSWLTGEELRALTERDLALIGEEITLNWLMRRRVSRGAC